MNHNVPSRRYLPKLQPQHFADAAAYAISHHRAAQGFFHADAEASSRGGVWAEEN